MAARMGEAFDRTGHPADLLSSTYPSVGTVLDALDEMAALWDEFTVVRVLAPLSCDPLISVERDERVTRVDMSAVLRQFVSDRTGQPTAHNVVQVMGGLRRWVDTLPISDREAAAEGIRLVTWADPARASWRWTWLSPGERRSLSWTPSATMTAGAGKLVRAGATEHALAQLRHVDFAPDGTAVVWRHRDPRLSGVIFADPDAARRWQTGQALVCVYTPASPSWARPQRPRRRLAEETMVDHRLLTFPRRPVALTWKKELT